MADDKDDGLTPIQRALKMKTQALAARNGRPAADPKSDQAAAHRSASRNKPWMKKV